MPLSDFPLRASIAVSDIERAVAFYEGKLGLQPLWSGPSAKVPSGSRVYGSGGGPALTVYQSVSAGKSSATLATWYVDDIDQDLRHRSQQLSAEQTGGRALRRRADALVWPVRPRTAAYRLGCSC